LHYCICSEPQSLPSEQILNIGTAIRILWAKHTSLHPNETVSQFQVYIHLKCSHTKNLEKIGLASARDIHSYTTRHTQNISLDWLLALNEARECQSFGLTTLDTTRFESTKGDGKTTHMLLFSQE
jgi:hypothetical protein